MHALVERLKMLEKGKCDLCATMKRKSCCETFFNVANICQKLHSGGGCLLDDDHQIIIIIILLLSDGPISGANRGVFVHGQWPVGRFFPLTFSLHFYRIFYLIFFWAVILNHQWFLSDLTNKPTTKLLHVRKTVQIVFLARTMF